MQQAPCAAAGSQQVAIPHEAPYAARLQPCSMSGDPSMLLAYNYAACSLCCSRLPTSGDTARGSLCCLITTMQHAPYAAAGSQQVAIPHEAPYAA
jgi:hypothetical protein